MQNCDDRKLTKRKRQQHFVKSAFSIVFEHIRGEALIFWMLIILFAYMKINIFVEKKELGRKLPPNPSIGECVFLLPHLLNDHRSENFRLLLRKFSF